MEKTFFEDFKKIQDELETIGRNAEGFKYKYADLPKIWENIKDIISKNNFIVYHLVEVDGVRTIAQHSSEEKLESFIPFSGILKPQDRGSEITYFKRYNIQALFNVMIVDEDDDAKSANDNLAKEVAQSFTPAELKKLQAQNMLQCTDCGNTDIKISAQGRVYCPQAFKDKSHKKEYGFVKNVPFN